MLGKLNNFPLVKCKKDDFILKVKCGILGAMKIMDNSKERLGAGKPVIYIHL